MRRRLEEIAVYNFPRHGGGMVLPSFTHTWYVDTGALGRDGRDGRDHRHPLKTVQAAINRAAQAQVSNIVETGQTIYVHGDVTEQVIVPQELKALRIIGVDGATWAASAIPLGGIALVDLWATHVVVEGFRMTAVADYYSVRLSAAGDDTVGADASFAQLRHNTFRLGLGGIVDAGGNTNVEVEENVLIGATSAAIRLVEIDIAAIPEIVQTPISWKINGNKFGLGNASHIIMSMIEAEIEENKFMTVLAAAQYIDLTDLETGDEADNMVGPGNVFAGVYAHADYQDATGDVWAGNYTIGGITTANPAA